MHLDISLDLTASKASEFDACTVDPVVCFLSKNKSKQLRKGLVGRMHKYDTRLLVAEELEFSSSLLKKKSKKLRMDNTIPKKKSKKYSGSFGCWRQSLTRFENWRLQIFFLVFFDRFFQSSFEYLHKNLESPIIRSLDNQ